VKRAADAVLLGITVVWGVTFVVVKDALGHADPLTFLALRFGLAAIAGAVFVNRRLLDRSLWRPAAALSVFLVAGYQLQTWGLVWTSPSRSAFLTGLCVVIVPFISGVFFKRPIARAAIAGAVIAAVGLYVLTGAGTAAGTLLGDGLTLGCAIAYAFHIALTERFAAEHRAFPLVTAQLILSALMFTAAVPLGEHRADGSPALIVGVIITGLFATTLAIGMQTWAQARTSAVKAALIYALEPVFAAGYSALTGGDRPGLRELAGGALIIAGVIFGSAPQGRTPTTLGSAH
jgi:drug/metabolite transporter (DMT)-like permease